MRRSPGRPILAAFSSAFWRFAGSTRQRRPSPSRSSFSRATAGSFVGLAFGAGSPRRFRHAAYGETDRPARPELFHSAKEGPIEQLPNDTLVFLLGSRYCETDKL